MPDLWTIIWVLSFGGLIVYAFGEALRLTYLVWIGLVLLSWAFILAVGWVLWMAFWF